MPPKAGPRVCPAEAGPEGKVFGSGQSSKLRSQSLVMSLLVREILNCLKLTLASDFRPTLQSGTMTMCRKRLLKPGHSCMRAVIEREKRRRKCKKQYAC